MGDWISFSALAFSTAAVLATLIALMAWVAFSRSVYPGFRLWLVALCLLFLAPATLLAFPADSSLRGWRLFVSWMPFLASSVTAHEGIRRFRGRPSTWRYDAVLVSVAMAVAAFARLLDASYAVLLAILSVAMVTVLARAAIACTRGVRPRLRPAYYVLGAGLMLQALVTAARALIVLVGSLRSAEAAREVAEVTLYFGGSISTMVAVVGAILSVGQRQEVEMLDVQEVLRRQATTDSLTGLPNRRHFFELAHECLESGSPDHAQHVRFSVILFDIDHFKAINDSFGHDLGDLVLRRVADALVETLPSASALGRLGGEEFVALLPGETADAEERARETLAAVSREAHQGILRRPVTISAGIAAVGREGLDEALRLADQQLYAAKGAGRNRVVRSRT